MAFYTKVLTVTLLALLLTLVLTIAGCAPSKAYCKADADCVPQCLKECVNSEWSKNNPVECGQPEPHGQVPDCICTQNKCGFR